MTAEIPSVSLPKINVKSISPTSSVDEPAKADKKDFFSTLTRVFNEQVKGLNFDPELEVFLPNKPLV